MTAGVTDGGRGKGVMCLSNKKFGKKEKMENSDNV